MLRPTRFAVALSLALVPAAALADGGIQRSQHLGRGTAQVGAFTARVGGASTVTYNPAAITHLEGFEFEGGLDFSNATDLYSSASGSFRANHTIQFPPAVYATWHPESLGPWAFGLGIDTPAWYRTDWNVALFPGRFETRTQELRLWEIHPVAAYELDDHWSVGGGLRYLFGSLEQGFNFAGSVPATSSAPGFDFELETLAKASVDAISFDLATHYDSTIWGFGAVYRHEADLEADDEFRVSVRDSTSPARNGEVLARFPFDRAEQNFSLPSELRAGAWLAPYPELRVELDIAFRRWSGLDDSVTTITSPTAAPVVRTRRRDWNNTLSLRLGVEGDLTDALSIGGGIALEPSPVPENTLEPGFPRGDALVLGVGASYVVEAITFDLGYSFHDYSNQNVRGIESNPTTPGRFEGREQVWSVSVRWRR